MNAALEIQASAAGTNPSLVIPERHAAAQYAAEAEAWAVRMPDEQLW